LQIGLYSGAATRAASGYLSKTLAGQGILPYQSPLMTLPLDKLPQHVAFVAPKARFMRAIKATQ
jgi:hypothetical protein